VRNIGDQICALRRLHDEGVGETVYVGSVDIRRRSPRGRIGAQSSRKRAACR
jgi:hypothetical protein